MSHIKVSDDQIYYEAKSLTELQEIFREFKPEIGVGGWLYRGQSDKEWPLIPKIGRPEFSSVLAQNDDGGILSEWIKKAVAYYNLPKTELECLAVAQHHGLATRLLDWSNNPLVATYFSCKEHPDKDGAIYLFYPKNIIDETANLTEIDEIKQYIPRSIASRIVNQCGRFTYHPKPNESIDFCDIGFPFVGQQLKKIIINKEVKDKILDELNIYNINEEGIFPDLDGLSRHINWLRINKKGL